MRSGVGDHQQTEAALALSTCILQLPAAAAASHPGEHEERPVQLQPLSHPLLKSQGPSERMGEYSNLTMRVL